jgi:hypothetical protein
MSSYVDLTNDAIAGIDLLASRPDMDARLIELYGHSEGGSIAPIAAVHAPSKVAFVVAEDTVAGLVRDQDVYRVSHQIRQAGFTEGQVERALELYKLMIEVLVGRSRITNSRLRVGRSEMKTGTNGSQYHTSSLTCGPGIQKLATSTLLSSGSRCMHPCC